MTPLRTFFLVVVCALAACAPRGFRADKREPEDQIRIPHDRHIEAKVECISCHEEIYDATSLTPQRILPKEEKCLECHSEKKEEGKCEFCHTNPSRPDSYSGREHRVNVSHTAHIDLVEEDCSRCHKALPNPYAKDLVPPMKACTSCHEHEEEFEEGRCTPCHNDLKRYPIRPVAVFSHQGDFVKNHRAPARSDDAICSQCHDQTFCADCHTKTTASPIELKFPEDVESDFIHRGDYVSRHTLDAKADASLCSRCHGQSFCDSCHKLENLTPLSANPKAPHPPGWAMPGSPSFHGPEARSDISSCAACHDQGPRSICIDCHKVGGIGGNPHPDGWLSRHKPNEIQQNGMCLYCH